jgi:hypothetical protein
MAEPMSNGEKVAAYLRLYERQMTHYEKTQDVEWKGSFGVWTLLAAAIVWAMKNRAAVPEDMWRPVLIGVVLVHALWLVLVHQSEETDKELWSRYRDSVEALLGRTAPTRRFAWWRNLGRALSWLMRRALWLMVEAGITAGMAWLLWSIVDRG